MYKKLFKLSFFSMLIVSISTGCKKDFLDVPPQGALTVEQALVDPAAADKLVTGAYNSLYSQGTVGLKLVIAADVTSDDSDKGSTPSDAGFGGNELDVFTYTPNTLIFNDLWVEHYKGINRINQALNVLEAGTYAEATKKRLIGEVRFLRGYFYFNLVRMFGAVPKLIRVPNASEANADEFQTRATKEAIYQVIVDDLLYGVTNLPEKGAAGSQVGRATKGAAQSLLSKVYLYQQKYQLAFDASLTVINSNKYSLGADYANVFREVGNNNVESIFEVQTGAANTATGGCAVNQNYSNFQGPRGAFPSQTVGGQLYNGGDLGFGLNTPTANLANAYEAGDVRRNATIIFTSNSSPTVLWDGFTIPSQPAVTNERYNYKAYHSPFLETKACNGIDDKDNKPKNIRIIRFAEVLLINAEAAAQLGLNALTPLSRVRSRAGLTTTTATINDVLKERRVELAMEADRFFDLVRTNRAALVMTAHGKPFVAGKHELFPIPQIQRDFSGGRISQNPNY